MKFVTVVFFCFGMVFSLCAVEKCQVKIVKDAVPGSTTRPALGRLRKSLARYKPYLAVIYFGMNDSVNDKKAVPISEFKKNMSELVALCRQQSVKPVLVTVNPVIEAPLYRRHDKSFYISRGGANEIIKRYNAAIIAVAKENGIDFIDYHKAVENAGGATLDKTSPIAPDGVHPSYKGKRMLAKLVAEYVRKNYKEGGTVLCIGDSITYQGYPDLIVNLLHPARSFTYTTSSKSTGKHRDTTPPGMLNDGVSGNAVRESVEYHDDVKITVDLEESAKIAEVALFAYNHASCRPAKVAFFISDDKKAWKKIGEVSNEYPDQKSVKVPAVKFGVDVGTKAKFIRIDVKRSKGVDRVLLGEVSLK